MSYVRRLRGLELVSLENTKCLMGGSKEDGAQWCPGTSLRGSGHKLNFNKFQVTILGDIQKPTGSDHGQCAVADPVLSRGHGLGDPQLFFYFNHSVILSFFSAGISKTLGTTFGTMTNVLN